MHEDGIDITSHTLDTIEKYAHLQFVYVITVCDSAKEKCPYFPASVQHLHHNFPDPAKATGTETEIMEAFRKVRELIKTFCKEFAENLMN